MVDWTIDKIVRDKPAGPDASKKLADEVFKQTTVANTCARFPTYLTSLVNQMHKATQADDAKPGDALPP